MASQICSICNQEAPGTARFCPNCAAPLGAGAAQTQGPEEPAAPSIIEKEGQARTRLEKAAWHSQRILIAILIAALAVVGGLAAYSLHQSSLLASQEGALRPAPSLVAAQTASLPSAPSVVGAQKGTPPIGAPLVGAQGKQPTTAPAEVLDYLDFLGKIEQERVTLKNSVNSSLAMYGAAKSMQGATEPEQQQGAKSQINSGYTDYTSQWQALMGQFEAKQPPTECETLASSYYRLLQDYAAFISQIQVAMQNNDLSTLMNLQGSAQGQINTDVLASDSDLSTLCQKYQIPKPFNIQSDSAGSGTSLLGP